MKIPDLSLRRLLPPLLALLFLGANLLLLPWLYPPLEAERLAIALALSALLVWLLAALLVHLLFTRRMGALAHTELKIASSVFETVAEGIVVTDPEARIEAVNPAFSRITGYSEAEAVGQNPRILKSDRQDVDFYAAMWRSLRREGRWQGEIWNRRKGGDVYPEWLSIVAVRADSGTTGRYVGVFVDITERKQAEAMIERRATHDMLTDLPNRALFMERLDQAVAHGRRLGDRAALLFVDLDRFKAVNDTRGHRVGDLLLREVAQRLTMTIRETDTVARLGGDEFTIILQDVESREAAAQVARHVVQVLSRPFRIEGEDVQIGASVGIALFPENGADSEVLLSHADAAMYRAKALGNRHAFYEAGSAP